MRLGIKFYKNILQKTFVRKIKPSNTQPSDIKQEAIKESLLKPKSAFDLSDGFEKYDSTVKPAKNKERKEGKEGKEGKSYSNDRKDLKINEIEEKINEKKRKFEKTIFENSVETEFDSVGYNKRKKNNKIKGAISNENRKYDDDNGYKGKRDYRNNEEDEFRQGKYRNSRGGSNDYQMNRENREKKENNENYRYNNHSNQNSYNQRGGIYNESYNNNKREVNDNSYDKRPSSTRPKHFERKVTKDTETITDNNNDSTINQKQKSTKSKPNIKFEFNKEEEEELNPNILFSVYDYLYGSHIIKAALTNSSRKIHELYILNNYKDSEKVKSNRLSEISLLAKEKSIPISFLSKERLDRFSGGKPHNGVVLKTERKEYKTVKSFKDLNEIIETKSKTGKVIVVLDQILDPQNFGGLIRTAFFLGVDAIVVNKKGQPVIGALISKVSSGACECVDIYSEGNLRKFLKEAKKEGFKVISSEIETEKDVVIKSELEVKEERELKEEEEESKRKVNVNDLCLNKEENVVVIFSSEYAFQSNKRKFEADENENEAENDGSLTVYEKYIDYKTYINTGFISEAYSNVVKSLNVSVAAGVILNKIISQVKEKRIENKH